MTTKSLEDLTTNELLEHAKKSDEGARLMNSLLSDPALRGDALRLLKKKNPAMAIPELDSTSALEKRLEDESTARQKLEADMRERDIRDRIKSERDRVIKTYDLTDADMAEVEKIMTDEKAPIPHYDAAVKVYRAQKVQATPTSHLLNPPMFEMPTKDVWGPGVGNKARLNKIGMEQAYAAWNEIHTGGRRAA